LDPWSIACTDTSSRVNETALQEYEEFEREVRNAEFQKEIEIDEKTRHVLPRDWRTNKRWASNLRACCMCGMLKTQVPMTSSMPPLCASDADAEAMPTLTRTSKSIDKADVQGLTMGGLLNGAGL
jgi:hypothetical protein